MKRKTYLKKIRLANDLMFYIYTHIESDINLDELAASMEIDKFYLHKIFKEIFGRNIYESIKSIRLQKASNLLLTNRYSTISQVANECGYSSQTSFIRAFKERFGMTPKTWRKGGYVDYSNMLIENHMVIKGSNALFEDMEPTIVKQPPLYAYYIRDRGYDEGIKRSWQKIQTLIHTHNLTDYQLISLFHDNPAITSISECHHVSSIAIGKETEAINLPKFKIAGGTYAIFEITGKKPDLLRFIQWVYHEWLPQSGYETTTKPPYAIYHKNHHLSEDGCFSMDFYLSITL